MAAVATVAVMLLVGALWSLAPLCQRVADAEWERDNLLRKRTDVPDLVAEVRRLTAALATARREGAEEMRERCAVRCEELAEQESAIARAAEARGDQYSAAIRRDRAIARLQAAADIRTLPLDAPGGAT